MTNRFYTPTRVLGALGALGANYSVHSFSFSGEQYFRYCAELDQELLELEHRVNFRQTLKPPTSDTSPTHDSREALIRKKAAPTYDESGYLTDSEIDVRWI